MMRRMHVAAICVAMAVGMNYAPSGAADGEGEKVALPEPEMTGGKPLMEALKNRQTTREFSGKPLPEQALSNLVWAAAGVNRPEEGKRTAPSAMNSQEIDVYVALASGFYFYDSKEHSLRRILAQDIRTKSGGQAFVKTAPVSLVYIADYSKMVKARENDRAFYAAIDTGFISQNVYLFCASEGLATVVHDGIDREALSKAIGLRPDQKPILAQCVGYPSPKE